MIPHDSIAKIITSAITKFHAQKHIEKMLIRADIGQISDINV